jgi:hypothetical protein
MAMGTYGRSSSAWDGPVPALYNCTAAAGTRHTTALGLQLYCCACWTLLCAAILCHLLGGRRGAGWPPAVRLHEHCS